MIIHIAGTSGSGKTYIGNLFKNKINVIDLDNWTEEFNIKKNKTHKSFIKFINNKINDLNQNKINLLVGYLDTYIDKKIIIYELNADYKFFIKISSKNLFIQYNTRLLNFLCKNKDKIIKNINEYTLPNNFKTIEELEKNYMNDMNDYINDLKYILYTPNQIIKKINKIITLFY